ALCLSAVSVFGVAPPAKTPAEWLKLIDQLGDDNTRAAAQKKLEALGEDVLPALRRASKSHDDVDVRLRAVLVVAAIDKKTYREVRAYEGHTDGPIAFALSPDGKKMVSGCWGNLTEHVARIWDVKSGKELLQLKGHTSGVVCFAWSKDGKHV